MLSNEARARLDELAAEHPDRTKSSVVEDLLLGHATRK
jgi:predicted transcriptional regulator